MSEAEQGNTEDRLGPGDMMLTNAGGRVLVDAFAVVAVKEYTPTTLRRTVGGGTQKVGGTPITRVMLNIRGNDKSETGLVEIIVDQDFNTVVKMRQEALSRASPFGVAPGPRR